MTFYKTLFARMGNIKAGKYTSDDGEDLNDTEKVLKKNGIALRDNTNRFRDFGDVLDEVASKWDNYDNVTQHAIATAFAGTRQQEKFFVLMENYSTALEYEAVAAESAGTANKKYTDAYLDSIEARKNAFTAAYESLSQTILNSELIKTFYGVLTKVINLVDGFLQTGLGKFTGIATVLMGIFAVVQKLISALSQLKAGVSGILSLFGASAGSSAGAAGAGVASGAAAGGWIGLAIAAVAAVVMSVVSAYKQQQEELAKARQESINLWNTEKNRAAQLSELYSEYSKLTRASSNYWDVEGQIVDLLGSKASLLSNITKGTDEYKKAVEDLAAAELHELRLVSQRSAVASVENFRLTNLTGTSTDKTFGWIYNLLAGYKNSQWRTDSDVDTTSILREAGVDVSNLNFESGAREAGKNNWLLNLVTTALGVPYIGGAINLVGAVDNAGTTRLGGIQNKNDLASQIGDYVIYATALKALEDAANSSDVITKGKILGSTAYSEVLNGYNAGKSLEDAIKSNIEAATFGSTPQTAEDRQNLLDYTMRYLNSVFNYTFEDSDVMSEKIAQWFEEILPIKQSAGQSSRTPSIYDELKSSRLNGVISNTNEITKAVEEMNSSGAISLDTAQKLADLGEEYVSTITIENGVLKVNSDALRLLTIQKIEDARATALQNGAAEETIKLYDKLIEDAKKLGTTSTLERFLNLVDYENTIFDFVGGEDNDNNRLKNFERARQYIFKEITSLRQQGASIDDDTVMSLYKKYIEYSNSAISLKKELLSSDNDAQRELIEKENDALEKQKDLLEDILEARKEALENLKNERRYQDELADKQKAVSDLETRLATARLDTSASGRANARKIEDELRKARKDLDDFNFDHAVDVVSDKLDAEKDENERIYQKQKADNEALLDKYIKENNSALDAYKQGLADEDNILLTALGTLTGEGSVLNSIETIIREIASEIGVGAESPDEKRKRDLERQYRDAKYTAEEEYYTRLYLDEQAKIRAREAEMRYNAEMAGKAPLWMWYKEYDPEEEIRNPGAVHKYHSGGIVSSLKLKDNETFAKLMKGEYVATPEQMSRFVNNTLPNLAGVGGTQEFNAPLITLQVGSVTEESLPRLEAIVKQAADKVKSELMEGFSKTGFRSSNKRTLSYKVPAT